MSNLLRYTQQIFASLAGNNQLSEYGSFIASPPGNLYNGSTITPAIVQQLSNYLEGLYAATGGAYSPTIQDHNSLFYLLSYQIAYLLQKGIPEWDPGTTYYINDFVKVGEQLYISLQNTNLNHLVTDNSWWRFPNVNANSLTSITDINAETDITSNTGKIETLLGEIISYTSVTARNGKLIGKGVEVKNQQAVQFDSNNGKSVSLRAASPVRDCDYNLPNDYPTTSGQSFVSDTSGNTSWINLLGNIGLTYTNSTQLNASFNNPNWFQCLAITIPSFGKFILSGQLTTTVGGGDTIAIHVGITPSVSASVSPPSGAILGDNYIDLKVPGGVSASQTLAISNTYINNNTGATSIYLNIYSSTGFNITPFVNARITAVCVGN